MPCRCDDYPPTSTRDVYDDRAKKERDAIKKSLDEVTQNLCYLCGTVIHDLLREDVLKGNRRLYQWWRAHLAADEKRVRDEMRKYVSKLSKDHYNPHVVASYFVDKAKKVHPVSAFHCKWFFDLASQTLLEKETAIEAAARKVELKKQALNKLTDEERKVLGL
jgi:hypothetical protein